MLDPDAVLTRLRASGGGELSDPEVRYLELEPGRSLLVLWRVRRDDAAAHVVLTAGLPAPEIAWFPHDPALPLLGAPAEDLAGRLGVPLDGVPELLAWVPRRRATLRCGDVVVKLYATAGEAATAARAMRLAAGWLDSPSLVGLDAGAGVTAQTALAGRPLDRGDFAAVAGEAGAMLRRLHGAPLGELPEVTPHDLLALCRDAGARVCVALPALSDRVAVVLERLAVTMPRGLPGVPSHGDFTIGQMLDDGGRVRVVDTDTLCTAPAAHDLAAFAANLVSGRPEDAGDARAALDAVVGGYGARPDGLDWHLAAAVMRRVDRPLRRLKRRWPERTGRILAAVERLLER